MRTVSDGCHGEGERGRPDNPEPTLKEIGRVLPNLSAAQSPTPGPARHQNLAAGQSRSQVCKTGFSRCKQRSQPSEDKY